jgi:hypothetical protein
VGSGVKVSVAIIRAVLLTHSGFHDNTINKIVMLNPIAIGLTGHL